MVGAGYFTDMPLYRSVPNFLVQFGIQKDHPSFDKFCKGPPIQDDQNHQMQVRKGMIAFAGGGQNSRTCQIFVSYTDTNPHLGQQVRCAWLACLVGQPHGRTRARATHTQRTRNARATHTHPTRVIASRRTHAAVGDALR